jgi:hypothetical protein
MHLQSTELEP